MLPPYSLQGGPAAAQDLDGDADIAGIALAVDADASGAGGRATRITAKGQGRHKITAKENADREVANFWMLNSLSVLRRDFDPSHSLVRVCETLLGLELFSGVWKPLCLFLVGFMKVGTAIRSLEPEGLAPIKDGFG